VFLCMQVCVQALESANDLFYVRIHIYMYICVYKSIFAYRHTYKDTRLGFCMYI